MGTQNLENIVQVTEYISPLSAPRRSFNEMLIVGLQGAGIFDAGERVRQYSNAGGMLEDGFTPDDPEYKAAVMYFSQSPAPRKLWIGYKNVSPDEEWIDAIEACRQADSSWYVFVCLGIDDPADHIALATWAEASLPTSIYAFTSNDENAIINSEDDVFSHLKELGFRRTIGQYSENEYAIAAIMGFAMGANTGLANTAYTLKFKGEVGVVVENLTQTEVGYLDSKNANVYLNYANYYNIFQQGKMASGVFFDEVINLDMLRNDIQLNVMDVLYQKMKVPQTDAGQVILISACNNACELAVDRGFLAPGRWAGENIINLNYGDTLVKGYVCQSESYDLQAQADREARKAMPIYISVKEAGAVHSITIGVWVER